MDEIGTNGGRSGQQPDRKGGLSEPTSKPSLTVGLLPGPELAAGEIVEFESQQV